MKSIVERLLRAGSANSIRCNTSNKKFVWKQTSDGKWFKFGNSLQAANVDGMSENPLYTPEDTPNSFVCGVCSTALHFQLQDDWGEDIRCSICDAVCLSSTVPLTCDSCELYICCGETEDYYDAVQQNWKSIPSCYNSYYDQVETVRQEFYNRPEILSQYSKTDQQHWLQCMWHDIDQNMNRFRAELHHATQVETIDTTNASLVVENLGLEMTKSLVRLFVIFQSKFDTDIVEWFSSLIQHQREPCASIALQTSVKLNGRLEQLKWLVQELSLNVTNYDFSGALKLAAKMGRLDIVEYILEDVRADPTAGDNVAIRIASCNGRLNVVERLLQDDRVDPTTGDNGAIRWASRDGHLNVVERLLQDDRVDPSACDNDAVRWASSKGHLNVVERLLQDDRVEPSADDNCAIREASRHGHVKVVERLLQDVRVDPSADDNYAIRMACAWGHLNVVERLLQDDRVDPSAYDNFAIRTASRPVVWWNPAEKFSIVKRLLEDSRVDPAARSCEAMRTANDDKIIKCLYDRTRSVVCFMSDDEDMMKKITPLHNESLVMGGLCLSHMGSADANVKTLPQDVSFVILSEWASLLV